MGLMILCKLDYQLEKRSLWELQTLKDGDIPTATFVDILGLFQFSGILFDCIDNGTRCVFLSIYITRSEDAKAQQMIFRHWIEAIDPRQRYGHSLHQYYDECNKAKLGPPAGTDILLN